MPGQRYPDLEEAAPVKMGEQMGGDTLEAEPTGLGDGGDGEQEGKDDERDDFPRCGSGNTVDGGPFTERGETGGGWADGREEEGRLPLKCGTCSSKAWRGGPGRAGQQRHSWALYAEMGHWGL